jgi:hypothetical protein
VCCMNSQMAKYRCSANKWDENNSKQMLNMMVMVVVLVVRMMKKKKDKLVCACVRTYVYNSQHSAFMYVVLCSVFNIVCLGNWLASSPRLNAGRHFLLVLYFQY